MRILCVGVNHKTADLATRERLSYDPAASAGALGELRSRWPEAEFVLLSTCNRTEIYCARPVHGHPRETELAEALGHMRGLDLDRYRHSVYAFVQNEAARQLLRVAGGLDSLVLGETQVAGQVKQAYHLACELDCAGPIFHELFQRALASAKRLRSETDIAAGRVSVAGVAVDAAAEHFGDLQGRTVLSVGAGKMNRLMLLRLRELGVGRIIVLNRTPEAAAELAEGFQAACGGLEELPARLAEADVVIASTAADAPIITAAMLARVLAGRSDRPMLALDIAVPRDIEPAAGELPGLTLANIDDLDRAVAAHTHRRAAERDKCEQIVAEQVEQFSQWLIARQVAPTIEALARRFEQIAAEELASARNKFSTHDDAEADEQVLQRTLHRVIRRLLHSPTEALKAEAGGEAAQLHAAVLRRLFELEDQGPE